MTNETPQIPMSIKEPKPERAWRDAVDDTRRRSPASFDQWFQGVQFDGLEQGLLSLTARDEFVRDWGQGALPARAADDARAPAR